MAIEKAFAINASPFEIYAALERELQEAKAESEGAFEVRRRDPGRSLQLRVTVSGMPCLLDYNLLPRESHTEVVARLTPFGMRAMFFRLITLGFANQGFEAALVQGLVNLKAAVEGTQDGSEPQELLDPP